MCVPVSVLMCVFVHACEMASFSIEVGVCACFETLIVDCYASRRFVLLKL